MLRREDAATGVGAAYADIPGAVALEDRIPLAPTRQFAAPILGSVGPATAERIEESGGTVGAGDEVGLSGLQARYDDDLRGEPGVRVQAVDSEGSGRTLFRAGVRNGKDLRTTLDQDLQLKAERVLAGHVAPDGPHSALVAIRPSTGEVVAAANGAANDGFNAATAGQYPPGSTFKVVTALALLRSGMSPEDVVECGATTLVDGRSFKNYDDYPSGALGSITLTGAIANSCNTALISSRDRLDDDTLTSAAAALGLGIGPRPRLPGVLRPGAAASGRDREGSRPHRPGQGPRQPPDDGHRRRLRRRRQGGPPAAPPRAPTSTSRRLTSPSPRSRPTSCAP